MWKHIHSPDEGLITSIQPTQLSEKASPNILGMFIRNGVVSSDSGHTAFPPLSSTTTNVLNGIVMHGKQFYLFDGSAYFIALTTTCAYKYNTSTTTWDVISQGVEVDDCEAAWDAQANVISTADTSIKLRNNKSAKHVIDAAFTTGIVSSEDDLQNVNISAASNTHLSFWVRASEAIASDVFRLRLSEQITGGVGATYADYTIPALVKDTWQHVILPIASPVADSGGTYPGDLNALASIALVAQSDPGAVTLYLDDIRTIKAFTGDVDNRFSTDQMNDTFVMTNGVDQPQKWDGSGVFEDLGTTLAAGSITSSEIIIMAKDHLVFFNNIENGASVPQRASWTNIGTIDEHTKGTAGYQDIGDESWVIAVKKMSQSVWIVYKERSIEKMTWIGGHTPFRFEPMIADRGIIAKDGIFDLGGKHVVLDEGHIYGYTGGQEVQEIDAANHDDFFTSIDTEYDNRSFMLFVRKDNELQIWIPTTEEYPNTIWCLNTIRAVWYKKARTMTGQGSYQEQTSLTIGELVGTIGEQNYRIGDNLSKLGSPIDLVGDSSGKIYKLWDGTLNNDEVAITNVFETSDFTSQTLEKKEGSQALAGETQNKFFRVNQFIYEAKGQSIKSEYSLDGGDTWFSTQGNGTHIQALSSDWEIYEQDFDVVTRKIRFRFSNALVSSGFKLRYFGIYWLPRSGRR